MFKMDKTAGTFTVSSTEKTETHAAGQRVRRIPDAAKRPLAKEAADPA